MTYQVSVFLENKPGHLKRVTQVLRSAQINIRTMSLNHTANGWGILNLIVTDPDQACALLIEHGLSAAKREVVVLRMDDRPGGMDQLLGNLVDAGVNFTNAYGLVVQEGKIAFLAIDTEDVGDAREKLLRAGLEIIPDQDVYGK